MEHKLYMNAVILEKEHECLKNEFRNQKKIMETLLTDERKEQWITANNKNSEFENKFYKLQTPVPLSLWNRFQNLEEPSITEQHSNATPHNSHQNIPVENTKLKLKIEKRNSNPIRQEGKKNQRRPDNCITEKHLNNHVILCTNQRVVPENKTYASTTKYSKKIVAIGDSHLKRIKLNLFENYFDNAESLTKSFGGAKKEHETCYTIP